MNNFLHNSILYVNLEQVRQNVRTLLEELEGKALIPVLKGNAYGLGLEELGRTLAGFEEIRTLAVAQVSEGARLRRAGISGDILVLGGVPEGLLEVGAELDLTLAVWRLGVLPRLAELGRRLGRPVKAQVKVETGLHRVGLMPGEELSALLEEWRSAAPWVEITGAFSHFADLDDRERTEGQFQAFLAGTAQLEAGGMDIPFRHISASAASEFFPQYRLDGVRIGRRLYMDHPTRPKGNIGEAASWRTWITNLRDLQAGEPLGYGGHVRMERGGTVATLAVGYGDGLSPDLVRCSLGGGGPGCWPAAWTRPWRTSPASPARWGTRPPSTAMTGRGTSSPPRRCPCSSGTTRAAASPPCSATGWRGYTRNKTFRPEGSPPA